MPEKNEADKKLIVFTESSSNSTISVTTEKYAQNATQFGPEIPVQSTPTATNTTTTSTTTGRNYCNKP